MTNELVKVVAAPGAVFWETVKAPENIEILEGDARTRKLPKDKLRAAERKINDLQAALNVYFDAYIRYLKDKAQHASKQQRQQLEARITQVESRIKPARHTKKNPYAIRKTAEAKEALTTINRLTARVEEHYRALENERINERLRAEMQMEISFYAQQIVDRWTALGYREEYYIQNKRYLRRVRFEEAHFTQDNIQFKISVSHLTLLGSTVHHLPDKVRAWDLVKPETLLELELACECPVTSPHTEDDRQGFEKGAWIVVHRVGMRDGLFNYVELNKVLPKYNQGLRPTFAVPVGIKAGRQIEYLHLSEVPHIMFNGITGSGKTNIARVFLSVWCRFYSPDEIRFILVDLKRSGDLNQFADVPHLVGSIIKDMAGLVDIMPRLVALMQQRMDKLSAANCYDIKQYNKQVGPEHRMERLCVLVDECGSISDLAESKEQKEIVWRCMALLAAQARASGIHLMLGTQQPGREVIPSKVTNNITYTLSGRQRTTSGAMQALGNNKLKDLPAIQGRMAIDNGFTLIILQTPYATNEDITTATTIAKDYPTPRPFFLPGSEEVAEILEAADVAPPAGVTREQIIRLSLDKLGGIPSRDDLYELTGKVTPKAQVNAMIRAIASEREFEFEGECYEVRPYKKGVQFVKRVKSSPDSVSIETASTDVIADLSTEEVA